MSGSQRFLFDHEFEPPKARAAGRRAETGSATARAEEELASARRKGFEAGKQAGEQAAAEAAERCAARALDEISRNLTDLFRAVTEAGDRRDREVIETAMALVRKLFPALARTGGLEEIESLVGECLERLRDEPRIVVRVAEEVLDEVEKRISTRAVQSGFDGKIVYLAESEMTLDDVRVEWADGGAERDSARFWTVVDETVHRVFGPAEPARDPVETAPDPNSVDTTLSKPSDLGSVPDNARLSA